MWLAEAVEVITDPFRDTGALPECLDIIEPGVRAWRSLEGACRLDSRLAIDQASPAGVLKEKGRSVVGFEEQSDVEARARRRADHPIAAGGWDPTGKPRA